MWVLNVSLCSLMGLNLIRLIIVNLLICIILLIKSDMFCCFRFENLYKLI